MPVVAYRPETASKTHRYSRDPRVATANSQPTPLAWRPPPRLSSPRPCRRPRQSTDNFIAREKLGDFDRRCLGGVGTMYRILTDRLRMQFADRPISGLGGIGRAH